MTFSRAGSGSGEGGVRPVALVTVVGRTVGIGAGIAGDFLCSRRGGWISGQLPMSNGGFA